MVRFEPDQRGSQSHDQSGKQTFKAASDLDCEKAIASTLENSDGQLSLTSSDINLLSTDEGHWKSDGKSDAVPDDGPAFDSDVAVTLDKTVEFNRDEKRSADEPPVESLWGLTVGDVRFLTFCSSVIFVLSLVNLVGLLTPRSSQLVIVPPEGVQYSIDINEAGWVEWMQLPDIGETTARAIVQDRSDRGPFQSVDDVRRVRGIGPITLQKIRPFLQGPSSDRVASPVTGPADDDSNSIQPIE